LASVCNHVINDHVEIAQALGIDPQYVTGRELFSNLVLENVPGFTQLPPYTLLKFTKEGRPILQITLENNPCIVIGKEIAEAAGQPDLKSKVVKGAMHKRGVMAVAYTSGVIDIGDEVTIITPDEYLKDVS
jgi:hypothetical protein